MIKLISILLLFCFPTIMVAQSLSGTVKDKKSKEPLISATIRLLNQEGKSLYSTTNTEGQFSFKSLQPGNYTLQISYIGYKPHKESVLISASAKQVIQVNLSEDVQLLDAVSVKARATRAEQKGDSLVYNAEAFKVLEGSAAEELLSKMPGIVVEGGTVQAQGEDVKKVLVDGKEFFDGDINLALKNLPSDIIASIEVFDKKSEQAEFTGFDDGDDINTINIVTKTGYREGKFGEISGGYGTDDRYRATGNINLFDEDRRISILGMSNNVNQLNFSQEDLAGAISSSQGGRRKGGGRKGGSGGGRQKNGASGSGNTSANFMVGNMGGITSSNGAGLNYVDNWGEKLKFTGSYFFNQSTNHTETNTERQYFESALPGMSYTEFNNTEMENWNHRVNMKLDYTINENNSLQIKPSISFQDNNSTGEIQAANLLKGSPESEIENSSKSDINAYNMSTDIIYRHRFPVEGRTLSVALNGKLSNKSGTSYNDYINHTYGNPAQEEAYGTLKDTDEKQYSLRGNMTYTEKLSDALQLQANYKVSFSDTESDRKVYQRAAIADLYEQLDENLSNVYQTDYLTQSGGVGLRFRKNGLSCMAGIDLQYSSLQGEQYYPRHGDLGKNYFTPLPSFSARYALDRTNSFMLRYRSSSASPSVNDLQNVTDDTNPLFIRVGNPELDQQINHSLNIRYIRTTQSGHIFIGMLGATLCTSYIADSTFVATENTTLSSGIEMDKGAQFTKPVNMNGYYSLQSMLTYGFPIDFIRSNVNLSLSANYANLPTIFNGISSDTRELIIIPKVIIGSNISHNLDFTISYSASLNRLFNSLADSDNSEYVGHSAAAKLGWTFWNGFTLRSIFNYTSYAGLGDNDSDYLLWNASIGKKFLKNNRAEIKLEAFDLLNQNQAFSHQTGSNFIDLVNTNVLKPYAILSFTYTIR